MHQLPNYPVYHTYNKCIPRFIINFFPFVVTSILHSPPNHTSFFNYPNVAHTLSIAVVTFAPTYKFTNMSRLIRHGAYICCHASLPSSYYCLLCSPPSHTLRRHALLLGIQFTQPWQTTISTPFTFLPTSMTCTTQFHYTCPHIQ